MGQAEDYTITAETQQALCEFAVLNWVKSELTIEIESSKKLIEEIEDAQLECNTDSYLRVGESYAAITDELEGNDILEARKQRLEDKLSTDKRRLLDTEKESERLKTQIEAVMGDRVRLTAHD
eukprot:Protomagalhaensia_wolfi_Nauph_80__6321@NODE_983_length_1829_cov_167_807821_g742_i0_p4_GENE_NODE_983_length_1829_cov_167_807821_g742_i0NODE_983_length_1829_cov_167_807821_g742_i0_p4_ORF_typecomplete_len123_score19_38CENPF_leu_zip/PF10473_9/0_8CENPF_leu_zip/PF10473_9/9_2GP57/PF17594_2/6_1e02GP57/PF17594_2/0_42Prefoldin_2/PF01920_20/1_3APG6_N/PF17675_1/2_6e02APG6_N/PF17675_1/0_65Spc7/PF08317_11/3_8DUF4686/PF15742_5/67DUF3450/PF11932_8/48DUF3450/PF11932_8/1_8_NODE_983_length_1829_cov_167_807821_g742